MCLSWLKTLVLDEHKKEGAVNCATSSGLGQGTSGVLQPCCPLAGEKLI